MPDYERKLILIEKEGYSIETLEELHLLVGKILARCEDEGIKADFWKGIGIDLEIEYFREESDEKYNSRIKKEEELESKAKQKRKEQYLKLKKEFKGE